MRVDTYIEEHCECCGGINSCKDLEGDLLIEQVKICMEANGHKISLGCGKVKKDFICGVANAWDKKDYAKCVKEKKKKGKK